MRLCRDCKTPIGDSRTRCDDCVWEVYEEQRDEDHAGDWDARDYNPESDPKKYYQGEEE